MLRFIKNDPEELAAYIRSRERGLVVFDGRPTAGKTYLATDMAKRVPCVSVDTDDFVIRNQKTFLGALKLDALRDRVEQSLAVSPLVILSGVCGRHVVELAGLSATAFVWVEKSSLICMEIDQRDYAGDHHADLPYIDWLRCEVERYIKTFNARGHPEIVYLNAPD